jgi:hypothetical protein
MTDLIMGPGSCDVQVEKSPQLKEYVIDFPLRDN